MTSRLRRFEIKPTAIDLFSSYIWQRPWVSQTSDNFYQFGGAFCSSVTWLSHRVLPRQPQAATRPSQIGNIEVPVERTTSEHPAPRLVLKLAGFLAAKAGRHKVCQYGNSNALRDREAALFLHDRAARWHLKNG